VVGFVLDVAGGKNAFHAGAGGIGDGFLIQLPTLFSKLSTILQKRIFDENTISSFKTRRSS